MDDGVGFSRNHAVANHGIRAPACVGQASRLSHPKISLHLLVTAKQLEKHRLKAIIQSQRQARRLSYGMVPVQGAYASGV
jgi:hypothetical protein